VLRRNRSTRSGGIPLLDDPVPARVHPRGLRVGRTIGALIELARWHRRLDHVPTLTQMRALAYFDGREPCSYLLDPAVNFVPELLLGGEDPLGRHGLCFSGTDRESGRRFELVTLPDGCAFDLLGMSR
jgi:hypothetical protein